jgi:hypothetical protein
VSAAAWHRAHLLRGDERLAFTPKRFTDMRCPDPQLVKVSANNAAADGGETVELGRR